MKKTKSHILFIIDCFSLFDTVQLYTLLCLIKFTLARLLKEITIQGGRLCTASAP